MYGIGNGIDWCSQCGTYSKIDPVEWSENVPELVMRCRDYLINRAPLSDAKPHPFADLWDCVSPTGTRFGIR